MPYFDQDFYVAQKVAQMNATGYIGRTGTAGQVWTAESAQAELEAWNTTWEENFNLCNTSGYASTITAADINVSPNELFNVNEYAQALANYNNANQVDGRTDWTANGVIENLLQSGDHQSLWHHYTTTGAALGLNPSNAFDTMAWAEAQSASTGTPAAEILSDLAARGQNPVMGYLDGGGTVDAAPAVAEDAMVAVAAGFNPWAVPTTPDTPDTPSTPVYTEEIYLTDQLDVIQGTAANEHIIGQEFDGVNTLQSGDRIDGGAGSDLLTADLTAGSTFGQVLNAVRPEVHNVEIIKLTSQQSTDNHAGEAAIATVRADRIDGMTQLWDADSRASLEIDDVRVLSNRMTIGWQDSDNAHRAGQNLDYIVRYNNQFLAADDASNQSTLRLQVMDVAGAAQGQPLLDNVYDRIMFTYNGTQVTLDLSGMEGVSGASATYQTLLAAIQQAMADNPACEGLTATLDAKSFTYHPKNNPNVAYTGDAIIITAENGTLQAGGWATTGYVPADSDLDTDMLQAEVQNCPLLRTDIALDNVGMVNWFNVSTCIPNNQQFGDYAGDMMVGGMGNAQYVGLQRFDGTVDRGSWIESLQSTNHALRMVTFKNGDLNGDGVIGTSEADQGNLFIGKGLRLTDSSLYQNAIRGGSLMFEGRDGMLADATLAFGRGGTEINGSSVIARANDLDVETGDSSSTNVNYTGVTVGSGVVDVAVFDASEMTGKANIAASVSEYASKKYLADTDQVDALGNRFAPVEAFSYKFGSNDDTLNMHLNSRIVADNDFKMNINMGEGNNSVHTTISNDGNTGFRGNWLYDQAQLNNIVIATGSGDDIINPMGDGRTIVLAGAGNDVVYSDNGGIADNREIVGVGAVWVMNSVPGAEYVKVDSDGKIVPANNDIASNPAVTYDSNPAMVSKGTSATLQVNVYYKGIGGSAETTLNMVDINQAGTEGKFQFNTAQLNQLIKDAVNNPQNLPYAHLDDLLSAQEGQGNSLLLISKIDGVQTDDTKPIVTFTLKQSNPPEGDDGLVSVPTAEAYVAADKVVFAKEAVGGLDRVELTSADPFKAPVSIGWDQSVYANGDIVLGAGTELGYGTQLGLTAPIFYRDWYGEEQTWDPAEAGYVFTAWGGETIATTTPASAITFGNFANGTTFGVNTVLPVGTEFPAYLSGQLAVAEVKVENVHWTGAEVNGENSTAYANNIINLGTGDDIAVLSSSQHAHEQIVINDGDNGHAYLVNFSLGSDASYLPTNNYLASYGNDYLDITGVLGDVAYSAAKLTIANMESGLSQRGTETAHARQIVWVQNAPDTADNYIDSASALEAALNADGTPTNIHYNDVLYMFYDQKADATYSMYKANFDGNGNATVSDLGDITFSGWANSAGTGGDLFAQAAVTAQLGVKLVGVPSDLLSAVNTQMDDIPTE